MQTQTQLQIHTESVFIFSGPQSLSAEVPHQHTPNPCWLDRLIQAWKHFPFLFMFCQKSRSVTTQRTVHRINTSYCGSQWKQYHHFHILWICVHVHVRVCAWHKGDQEVRVCVAEFHSASCPQTESSGSSTLSRIVPALTYGKHLQKHTCIHTPSHWHVHV